MAVEVHRPDELGALGLPEIEPGIFEGELVAALDGVYGFHVRAIGGTMRGEPFTREQLLTAATVRGGDRPPPTSSPGDGDNVRALCALLACLLEPDRLGHVLEERGVDVKGVRECIDAWCRHRLGPPSEATLRAREGGPATRVDVPAETMPLTHQMIAALAEILSQPERERGSRD